MFGTLNRTPNEPNLATQHGEKESCGRIVMCPPWPNLKTWLELDPALLLTYLGDIRGGSSLEHIGETDPGTGQVTVLPAREKSRDSHLVLRVETTSSRIPHRTRQRSLQAKSLNTCTKVPSCGGRIRPSQEIHRFEDNHQESYQTPKSAIVFLIGIVLLSAIWLAIVLTWGGLNQLLLQLTGVGLLILEFLVVAVLARWWTGALGRRTAWCPTCGRGYTKTAGPFCPWDGAKLQPRP